MPHSIFDEPHLRNEEAAYAHVEAKIWRNGRVCPHCGVVGDSGLLRGKSGAPASRGQHGDPVKDLGLIDARRVERRTRLRRHPGQHCRMRLRPHQFGNDIGIENDHSFNFGGSPTGTRG